MKISSKFSYWAISLIIVIFFSIAATLVQIGIEQRHENEYLQNSVSAQTTYGQDGKPNGEKLDTVPTKITQDYIYFDDRVLGQYYYSSQAIDYTVETLNIVYDWMPDDINKFFIAAPMRIAIDPNIDVGYKEESIKAIEQICSELDSEILKINTLETLSAHADEYIFFRTDKAWTALGAYYVAKEFLIEKDIDIMPLDSYYDNLNIDYFGTLIYLDGVESLMQYPDLVYFYTLKGSSNIQSITAYDNNEYKEYTSPVIACSRGGTDIFIGEYYSHTIIEGDISGGASIIIIGDKYSKIFAPWLIPYYGKIILINPSFYMGDADTISEMIQEYSVNELLIIECQAMFGESIGNQVMNSMFAQPNYGEEE